MTVTKLILINALVKAPLSIKKKQFHLPTTHMKHFLRFLKPPCKSIIWSLYEQHPYMAAHCGGRCTQIVVHIYECFATPANFLSVWVSPGITTKQQKPEFRISATVPKGWQCAQIWQNKASRTQFLLLFQIVLTLTHKIRLPWAMTRRHFQLFIGS